MVTYDVQHDRRGIFCILLLLHRLRPRVELLAHQPFRCRHHEHVLGYSKGYAEECFWCCTVSNSVYVYVKLNTYFVIRKIGPDCSRWR